MQTKIIWISFYKVVSEIRFLDFSDPAEIPLCLFLIDFWVFICCSSFQRSPHLRLAFMKKLLTVLCSRPSCRDMVICISFEGLLVSRKMANRVLLCKSVNTSRFFFGWWVTPPFPQLFGIFVGPCIPCVASSSFFLQAKTKKKKFDGGKRLYSNFWRWN